MNHVNKSIPNGEQNKDLQLNFPSLASCVTYKNHFIQKEYTFQATSTANIWKSTLFVGNLQKASLPENLLLP